MNTGDLNISALRIPQENFSQSNKIYIKDNELRIGRPESGSNPGLKSVTEKIRSVIGENRAITDPILAENLTKLNQKIKKRNKNIAENTLLKTVNTFLKIISKGKLSLDVKELQFIGPASYIRPRRELNRRSEASNSLGAQQAQSRPKVADKAPVSELKSFEERVEDLMQDGMLNSINKTFNSTLKFEPDFDNNTTPVTREHRAALTARALIVAPPQPEGRPFEYVGFGAGAMRQDLHQVMGLIDEGVNNLHISLIDTEYAAPEEGKLRRHDYNACLRDFKEVLRLKYPEATVTIDLYPSSDEWLTRNPSSKIDLLTAVRVEVGHSLVEFALNNLEAQLADDSGILVSAASDTRIGMESIQANQVVKERCIRNGEQIRIQDVKKNREIRDLDYFAGSTVFIAPRPRPGKPIGRPQELKQQWDKAKT